MPQENREHLPHTVYTKLNWTDSEWTEEEGLFADSVVFSCAPDISKAVLYWRYGRVQGYGENEFHDREKKNLADYYVKISIERPDDDEGEEQGNLDWYGIVVSDVRELEGAIQIPSEDILDDPDGTQLAAGKQHITCLGLEYLLTRKVIDTSHIVSEGDGAYVTIKRAIGFNLGSGHDNSSIFWPNKSTSAVYPGFYHKLDGADTWTSLDIIRYLVALHSPRNEIGDLVLQWDVDENSNLEHLEWHKPMLRVHGHTLFDVLNMLIDRRRLSSWKVVVDVHVEEGFAFDTETLTPKIHVFTFNPETIQLPDDKTIEAAFSQSYWNFDSNKLVRQPVIETEAFTEYFQVTARGERAGACLTLASAESTLEKDWDSTLQTTYNTGAVGSSGYAAADEFTKQSRNRAYRETDKFKRVYRYFRIPPGWGGFVNNQVSPAFAYNAFYSPTTLITERFWHPGLRFENFIPLKTDITYGDTIAAEDMTATTGDTLAKSKKEWRRPFAVINTGTRYEYVDRLSKGDDADLLTVTTNGRHWSCSLRMADDAPAIIVDVNGPPQHLIALDEFSAADAADTADWVAELRWQTIYATVFLQADHYAEQTWPDVPAHTTDDVSKVLIINVPNMRLDYVVPSTVIGLNNDGTLLQTANGGFIHNDLAKLKQVARVAYEWYSIPRKSFTATEHSFDVIEVGTLITTIGDGDTEEEVNSVVTQLALNMRAGTHTITTQFGELDFQRAIL